MRGADGGVRGPLPPVRCDGCANGLVRLRRCRLAPFVRWPEEKPLGCLYYRAKSPRETRGYGHGR